MPEGGEGKTSSGASLPAHVASATATDTRHSAGWRDIASAPKDGTHFFGVVDGERRIVAWGKTSHVPLYGFCLADQGPEDFDLCDPLIWHPFPDLPAKAGATDRLDHLREAQPIPTGET